MYLFFINSLLSTCLTTGFFQKYMHTSALFRGRCA